MDNFEIYKDMGNLDFTEFFAVAGGCNWPKNKRYTVISKGITFKVGTYWSKGDEKIWSWGYDAYSAIDSVYIRELSWEEIGWETNGEPQYAEPRFNEEKLVLLDQAEWKRRAEFLAAVANLLNDQITMEAIVEAAVKKKNGTLNRNRALKLACSGIANGLNQVFALVARPKTDTSMSIVVEDVRSKPGDNELWANDFISTPHDGLRITEALKNMIKCNSSGFTAK